MRVYDLVIIQLGYVEGTANQLASVQAWQSAQQRLQTEGVSADFNLFATVASPENFTDQPWYQRLQISTFPVLLISDRATGALLVRINTGQITADNIYTAIREIDQLEYSEETGEFITPDGQPVGGDGIWPGGRGGFGGGWWLWLLLGGTYLLGRQQ